MLIPKSIQHIVNICASENTRYAVNGIHLSRDTSSADAEDHRSVAVATDGRRLLIARWQEPDIGDWPDLADRGDVNTVWDFWAIVPAKIWTEAHRSVPNGCKPILQHVLLEERRPVKGKPSEVSQPDLTLVTTDGETVRRLTSPQSDGKFPKYQDVVPALRDVFIDTTPEAEADEKPVGIIKVCNETAVGEPAVTIGFDPQLLASLCDTMNAMLPEGRGLTFTVPIDPTKAMIIRGRDCEGVDLLGVIMPYNVK